MSQERRESLQPNSKSQKHPGLRIALAAALGFFGTSGAILTGKAIIEEASKEKASATEKQPGGKMPSETAYEELTGSPSAATEDKTKPVPTLATQSTSTPPVAITKTPELANTPSLTPTPEAKPLPEVINNQTVKFVTLPPEEIEQMIQEAYARGEFKIPLPSILQNEGVEAKIITTKAGEEVIAITVSKEGIYTLPALLSGIVEKGNRIIPYFDLTFPTTTKNLSHQGDKLITGQPAYTVNYQESTKNTPEFQSFRKFTQQLYVDLPENAIAILARYVVNTEQGYKVYITNNLNFGNILKTPHGEVVVVIANNKSSTDNEIKPNNQALQYKIFPASGGSYISDILPPTSNWAARSEKK